MKDCPICFYPLSKKNWICVCCRNEIHYKCRKKWKFPTCPMCRHYEITMKEIFYRILIGIWFSFMLRCCYLEINQVYTQITEQTQQPHNIFDKFIHKFKRS